VDERAGKYLTFHMGQEEFGLRVTRVKERFWRRCFFASVGDEPAEDLDSGTPIRSRVAFRGTLSGNFTLTVTPNAARVLAADFLGIALEELADERTTEVACELANMVCEATLSRLKGAKQFNLSSPEIVPSDGAPDGMRFARASRRPPEHVPLLGRHALSDRFDESATRLYSDWVTDMRTFAVLLSSFLFLALSVAQAQDPGRQLYENRCAGCHGADGNGGELGPALIPRIPARTDEELRSVIHDGLTTAGMPSFPDFSSEEVRDLVTFLRALRPREGTEPAHRTVQTTSGTQISGLVLAQGTSDLQLLSDDHRIHLFRKSGNRFREVTSQSDWPSYHGQYSGNRYSTLTQITKSNVTRLAPKWIFTLPNTAPMQGTPIVVEGIMYVTSANECYALDAGNGRQLWHYQRSRTKGLIGNAAGGINRGVAISGERLFMVTDNAHLISLNRFTGKLLWETVMADWHQNYNATSAPLVVGDLVIPGTSGGDEGVRGFLAAYDAATGKEVWRFWTVPKPGEPLSETWQGKDIEHGCATTWLTGTYDPQLDTLYWPTGNPCPDLYGDKRLGDNLYSSTMLALEPKTGKLKWYFQYTPHNVWDWDAQQPPVLVDTNWQGQPRKLLIHANRNGFFYVLDRTNGKFLLGKPFVKALTWASGLTPEGRPILIPNQEPIPDGRRVCPSIDGASNWYSTSYNPVTGLYYVQTNERCTFFTKRVADWQAGRGYMGGSYQLPQGDTPQRILRAIDIHTGKVVWELPQTGPDNSWGGALSTASGVVFFGDDGGALSAADGTNGKLLWSFQTNHMWKASPMTYAFDNKQFVAVAAGSNILAFGLVE
jgi:alcohol dehydrogenase (cytochrome c)